MLKGQEKHGDVLRADRWFVLQKVKRTQLSCYAEHFECVIMKD
jgi:hypothetical protein